MNAELKSPLLVLSLAVVGWVGMNIAGTLVEKRGKVADEQRLAGLAREADESREGTAKVRGPAILVKPSANAPIEMAAVETKPDTIASVAGDSLDGQPKIGSIDAPVP